MTQRYQVKHIDAFDPEMPQLHELAFEWEATQEFWTAESCISTLKSSEKYLATALIDQSSSVAPWVGCYFAILQGDAWELLFVFVSKNARNQGLGRELMKDLIFRSKESAASQSHNDAKIFLEVRKSNIAAQKLYEGLGFNLVTQRKKYYQDGEDAYVYQLHDVI